RSDSGGDRACHRRCTRRRVRVAAQRRSCALCRGRNGIHCGPRSLPAARVSTPRPHPFTLVFGDLAPEKFPAVRDALNLDLRLEHFLMTPAAVELLHALRPDEGLGDTVD